MNIHKNLEFMATKKEIHSEISELLIMHTRK
jgi:hypothetical protein